ncbi:choline dehydrogenase [Alphaproteobacteria bacterium]|nr:choline dehydrogenase [Alphaproteobacteria bacterium]
MSRSTYDYVVVGSGSAGAIIASRLLANGKNSVLLLEAGPKDNSLLFRIPAAMRYAYNARKYNWNYETEPEPFLNNRILYQPRGKVLGGSSSINGMLYLRGNPMDYEAWSQQGARGWSYSEVLPYFKKLEKRIDQESNYHGTKGLVKVSTVAKLETLSKAFLEAGKQAGYLSSKDVNGFQQDGFGLFPKNISYGLRSSTSQSYLQDPPSNLYIKTDCYVTQLILNGKKVLGVDYLQNNKNLKAYCNKEVILSAGAFNSPLILLRSGIGSSDQLKEHGIEVIHHLPGVGENLSDHPCTAIHVQCTKPITLYKHLNLFSMTKGFINWLLAKKGFLTSNHFDVVGFIRTNAGIRFPNLQVALFAIGAEEGSNNFAKEHRFQLQISTQRPLSRGWVRLRSKDPFADPKIKFNLLEHPNDVDELITGFNLTRELLKQPALSVYTGKEITPGKKIQTKQEFEVWLRENCNSSYHPNGTCKMGDDPMAVVDSECRVHGIDNLRVADASIMPTIPSCNLNCPTMMIGEKASDMIMENSMPKSNLSYYTDPNWEKYQR